MQNVIKMMCQIYVLFILIILLFEIYYLIVLTFYYLIIIYHAFNLSQMLSLS
jgi:hypothetical protein